VRCNTPTEVQNESTSMSDELGGSVHDFLKDGTYAASLGGMPYRGDVAGQPQLA
jgi:hypothetical protein